jgi:hypothetical protein
MSGRAKGEKGFGKEDAKSDFLKTISPFHRNVCIGQTQNYTLHLQWAMANALLAGQFSRTADANVCSSAQASADEVLRPAHANCAFSSYFLATPDEPLLIF